MLKEKPSFFGKFSTDQDAKTSQFSQSPQQPVSMPVYTDDEQVQMPVSQMAQPAPQGAWEPDAEVADAEGQLTIDVYQTENDIVIKSTIAGVKPENLDVGINNDMLTIKGERTSEEDVSEENYYYQECYWGPFSRSVVLPTDVITDKIDATLKNGILTVRLPKADTTKTKKIQVRGF